MRLTTRTQLALLGLLLLVGVTSFPRRLSADVQAPQPFAPRIVISSSADYPEMIFVIYRIDQEKNSKGNTFPADPDTALIIPPVNGVQLPSKDLFVAAYLVLAVPRALADKTKNGPDPDWLEPSAPGVVRVSGILQVRPVYRAVLLRYELVKSDTGPSLKLLNPGEFEAARKMPAIPVDRSVEEARSQEQSQEEARSQEQSQQLLFWGVGSGGLLVLAGGAWLWWQLRRRNQPPARDNPS